LGVDPADFLVVEYAVPGVAASHAAGLLCVAIPYVAAQADAPEFAAAALLLRGGQREFTARAAHEWLTRSVRAA
ncbi:HAD family phosphatase, partial [Streptomyces prasinus]